MRWLAKYRHVLTAIVVVLGIGCLIYFGVRVQNIKKEKVDSQTFSGKTMGTAVKKTIYAGLSSEREEANQLIDATLEELDNQLSARIEDSETAKCNRNHVKDGYYELSASMYGYLKQEMEFYKETNGAFSPCILPLSRLWGIEDGNGELPSQKQIEEVLECTNPVNIELTEGSVVFHAEGMAIDFGAVGKGIAGDAVMEELSRTGVQGAVVSVGGSIAVYGNKGDGKLWHIGIQDPRGKDGEVLGVLDVAGGAMISTSGDYEKYFEADGKRYHHIFDPATGYPADSGLISVTVISGSGFWSDAMSTACFVMGLEKGMKYVEEKGVEAIFVTDEKKVYVTKGIRKRFNIRAEGYELAK